MFSKNILKKTILYTNWNKILYKINIKKIFSGNPPIFYELLVLINEKIITNEDYITQYIIQIVSNKGKELSVSSLEQIRFYAESIGNYTLTSNLNFLKK